MIESASSPPPQTESRPASAEKRRRRWLRLLGWAALLLVVLAVVPPFINISHFRRSIVQSISAGLGRPVHASAVELSLFPQPAFVLHNLTVGEDPAYGAEPMMMAGTVTASLRASTLWHARVEIASLSFDAPSLNLVRNAQGKWNFDSLLRNSPAIHSRSAAIATPRPPFPYVEATDARINFKLGAEKLPFSLEGADLAIWKESGDEWHARIEAHPVRTDLTVADAGEIRGEGVLKAGAVLKDSPVHASLEWRQVQLGEIGRLLHGEDDGWRGTVDWTAEARGTLEKILVTTEVGVEEFRRAEFVPSAEMDLTAHCRAQYLYDNRRLDALQCEAPLGDGRLVLHGRIAGTARMDAAGSAAPSNRVARNVAAPSRPQTRRHLRGPALGKTLSPDGGGDSTRPGTAEVQIALQHAPAEFFLDFLRHIHPGIAEDASTSGKVDGSVECAWRGLDTLQACTGSIHSSVLTLSLPHLDRPLKFSPLLLETNPANAAPTNASHRQRQGTGGENNNASIRSAANWSLAPVDVSLGGATPATIRGVWNSTGPALNIAGAANLAELAKLAQILKIPIISGQLQSVGGSVQLGLSLQSTWLPQTAALTFPATVQASQFTPSRWSGTLQLHNAALKLASLPGTVRLTSAQVNLTPTSVEWTGLNGTFAHIAFDGKVRWQTPCPTLKSACARTFTLHTPNLNTARLQAALRRNDDSADLLSVINPWASGPPKMPQVSGTLNADVLSVGPISLKKASLKLHLEGQSAQLMALSGHIFGGSLSGIGIEAATAKDSAKLPIPGVSVESSAGSAQWGNGEPAYTLHLALRGIQAARVAAIWQENWGRGSADAQIRLKTHGWSADDLARNATGKFNVAWRNGGLSNSFDVSPAGDALAKFLRWNAEGTIRDRTLTLDHSRMVLQSTAVAKGISAPAAQTVAGSVSFARVLDLQLQPSGISIHGPLAMPIVTPPATSQAMKMRPVVGKTLLEETMQTHVSKSRRGAPVFPSW